MGSTFFYPVHNKKLSINYTLITKSVQTLQLDGEFINIPSCLSYVQNTAITVIFPHNHFHIDIFSIIVYHKSDDGVRINLPQISTVLTRGDFLNDLSIYENIHFAETDFPIRFICPDYPNLFLLAHWHEQYELLFITEGTCDFFCGGKTIKTKPGDLIVANPSQVHGFHSQNGIRFYAFIVSKRFFADVDFGKDVFICPYIQGDETVKGCFEEYYKQFRSKEKGHDMLMKSIAYSLFAHLVKNYTVENNISEEKEHRHLKRLKTIFSYIESHYNEEINANILAKLTYVTESYFCRFFKKQTGLTVASYISELRIKNACHLLEETESGISSIAEKVGFEDANYFTRLFKRTIGMTPSEYRKANRKK